MPPRLLLSLTALPLALAGSAFAQTAPATAPAPIPDPVAQVRQDNAQIRKDNRNINYQRGEIAADNAGINADEARVGRDDRHQEYKELADAKVKKARDVYKRNSAIKTTDRQAPTLSAPRLVALLPASTNPVP